MSWKRLRWFAIVVIAMQVVPYGHDHQNSTMVAEPTWNAPETRALFKRACFDCHSNETVWPWYANVAPVSWLIQNDVDGGREHLNFSEWNREQRHAKDIAEEVGFGDMPPGIYLPLHPEAKLTDAEVRALIEGAEKTFGPQATGEPKAKLFQ